jgi:nicotinate-nucleotide adenylyltransferase
VGVTAILGGAFDPPHNGHVALAHGVEQRFRPERLVVLVASRPGHKDVVLAAAERLRLARAAFPWLDVELDDHARTVDLLEEPRFGDPLFVVGADELVDFPAWKRPDRVLELARLAVATRPGYPRERLDAVVRGLAAPERVEIFELEPVPVSSRDLRARAARGESIDAFVPLEVARLIRDEGLYRRAPGYTVAEPRGSEPT